ncbi:MAG TPA: retropepsin-like aspartic protease [Caulobacteraceae bacterium]|nr:retropepsin-like aspartic protease [Caulobacteraceae bacterium]
MSASNQTESVTGRFSRRRAAGLLTVGAILAPWCARAQPAASAAPLAPATPPVGDAAAPDVVAAKDLQDRMTVPVMVDGKGPYAFIVDTGSNRSAVSDALVQTLGLVSAGQLVVQTATAQGVADSVNVGRLSVGVRETRDLRAPVFKREDIGADGLLGIDALADQKIVMDFRAKQMSILASSARDGPGEVVVSARSRYGQLILVDSSFDDTDLYVVIDTGGEASIANSRFRALVQRKRREQVAVGQVISVTGVAADADFDVLPRVRVGGVQLFNLPVAYADVHAFEEFGLQSRPAMLLGMDVLRHFDRVSVDFKARRVRFLLPADALPPDQVPITVG